MAKEIIEEIFHSPEQEFDTHIKEELNHRIIFSGIYGIGKTEFLKWYFEKNKDRYNTVHLFPVNYSVATNKDIFRYLKFDIIYELVLNKDLQPEISNFTFLESLPVFVSHNLPKILAPLLLMLPCVGRTGFKFYEELKKVNEKFMAFHKEANESDLDKVDRFIEDEFQKEGSIHETNFITEFIIEALEKLKNGDSGRKENVLIIDDLDRIDPHHIFRLFNVFAAHFDYNDKHDNKFGFDKIIFVGDINNIREIFHHKYGLNVDFTGYMDKFYGDEIYHYLPTSEITRVSKKFIEEIKFAGDKSLIEFLIGWRALESDLVFILSELIQVRKMNLRSILKIRDLNFKLKVRNIPFTSNSDVKNYQILTIIYLEILNKIYGDIEQLKRAIKVCTKKYDDVKSIEALHELNYRIGDLVLILDFKNHLFDFNNNDNKEHQFAFNNLDINYTIREHSSQKIYHAIIKKHSILSEDLYFKLLMEVTISLQDKGFLN